MNEHIYNDEIRNIIYIGKTIERLDLYIRMEYPFEITRKEYIRLMKNLERAPKGTPYRYNINNYSELVKIMETEEEYRQHSCELFNCLENLFETMEVRV